MMRLKLLLVSCIGFAGCAAQPIFVPLPPSHPASPWAPESTPPPQSGTLAIREDSKVPPHPDWQIPGMRDDELHGHAAGRPSSMDMMGHGHMMMGESHSMQGGHGGHSGHSGKEAPGMVKMSAPKDQVDYAPKDAVHPYGREPKEHEPERHLDHTDSARRKAGFKAAPIAPPMKHGDKTDEGHDAHRMDDHSAKPAESHRESKPTPQPSTDTTAKQKAPIDHEAMGHTDHESPSIPKSEGRPSPADTPTPADHSHHG